MAVHTRKNDKKQNSGEYSYFVKKSKRPTIFEKPTIYGKCLFFPDALTYYCKMQ
jgi:hypothetical protein